MKRNLIATLTSLLVLSSNAFAGEPTDSDVRVYLNAKLPHGVNLYEIAFKNFVGADEGRGRTAVEGRVVLTDDYLVQDKNFFNRFVKHHGFNNTDFQKCYNHLTSKFGRAVAFRVSVPKTKILSLRANMNFLEGVSGFTFTGDPQIHGLAGTAASQHHNPVFLISGDGSDHPDLKKCLEFQSEALDDDAITKQELTDNLTSSTFVASWSWGEDERFRIETGEVIEWNVKNQSYTSFWVPATATVLNDGGWNNGRFKKGQAVQVGIFGRMYRNKDGSWKVSTELSVPDKRGDLHTLGRHYYQRGDHWELDRRGNKVFSQLRKVKE